MKSAFVGLSARFSLAAFALVLLATPSLAREVVLVENGESLAPIVVFEGAPPRTRQAADTLADYIEKVSGARPEVIEGLPDPLPEPAIWVGYQSVLDRLFPEMDFDFQHPEEILIAANGQHLVIAGRDRWDPENMRSTADNMLMHALYQEAEPTIEGVQQEYGTINAVYTFVQEHLDVRRFWPGESGLDVIERPTLAFAPFTFRYHPQIRQRDILSFARLRSRRRAHYQGSRDWLLFQRAYLGSLSSPLSGHAFVEWWAHYAESHPEYFALQPDGTRNAGLIDPAGGGGNAKICKSNPAVWQRWLADAELRLQRDPGMNAIAAGPNDGHSTGICVCQNCLAWDHPEGAPWRYNWAGLVQEYVAMTDRYHTFWNTLGRLLKERYPDRDLYIRAGMYGPSKPLPVAARLDDNILMAYVGHFPLIAESQREEEKAEWKAWTDYARMMIYRPNLFYQSGGILGMPEISLTRTAEDMRFLAENNGVGIAIDGAWSHWPTQGPQYYLMAQLAWNPYQDAEAVMEDYYRRGFGPAAEDIQAYWNLLEEAFHAYAELPRSRHFSPQGRRASREQVFTDAFLERLDGLLDSAAAKLADEPKGYRQRLDFVRGGFEFTRLVYTSVDLEPAAEEGNAEARAALAANWAGIEAIFAALPNAFSQVHVEHRLRWMQTGE